MALLQRDMAGGVLLVGQDGIDAGDLGVDEVGAEDGAPWGKRRSPSTGDRSRRTRTAGEPCPISAEERRQCPSHRIFETHTAPYVAF